MLHTTNRGIWKEEFSQQDLKPVSPTVMRRFGLSDETVKHVDSLEDLRKSPPNIVIGECKRTFKFVQNFFKEQELYKREKYVMGLGVFQQLQFGGEDKIKLIKPSPIKFKNIFRPYMGQPLHNKSILVFRTGGIGDLLFIQPNLRYLKEKYPTCKISFACGPQYQSMVQTWDCVDEMLDLPFTFNQLKNANYHVLFEGVIERCKEAHFENAYNMFSRWMGLDLPDELLVPKQEPKKELVEKCKKIMGEWGLGEKDFVLIHPTTRWRFKCWDKFDKLVE